MQISILLENTPRGPEFKAAHGLSIHIKTAKHSILFDAGPNAAFLENAETLGIDIAAADLCILSHGHYDHAGGLPLFCKRNKHAPIYLRDGAMGDYVVRKDDGSFGYIGVPKELSGEEARLVYTGESLVIDEELTLFSLPETQDYLSSANRCLMERTENSAAEDAFHHEQNLIITEGEKRVLLAGCAHSGIVNILRKAERIAGGEMDFVLAGFHLTDPSRGVDEPEELVESVARELLKRKTTRYITGHCTGSGPYAILADKMGNRITALQSGSMYFI